MTAHEDPGLEPPLSLPPPPPSSQPPRGQLLLPSLLEPTAPSCLPLCRPPPSGSPLLKCHLNVELAKGTMSPRRRNKALRTVEGASGQGQTREARKGTHFPGLRNQETVVFILPVPLRSVWPQSGPFSSGTLPSLKLASQGGCVHSQPRPSLGTHTRGPCRGAVGWRWRWVAYTHPGSKDGWVSTLQHVLQLLAGRGPAGCKQGSH